MPKHQKPWKTWRFWWAILKWIYKLLRETLKPPPPPPQPPQPPPSPPSRPDMSLEYIQNNAEAYYTASSGTAGDQVFVDQLGNHNDLERGSTTSTDSNDPRHLKESEAFIFSPGTTDNDFSVPDEAALDITGDIDVRIKVALPDYTNRNEDLVGKWGVALNNSWVFRITSSGTLTFVWSINGSSTTWHTSTAAVPTTDGDTVWLRATLDVDTGASTNEAKFYTSTDGSSWNQLGATVTGSGTTSIFSGTADVLFCDALTSYNPLTGNVFAAQVYDGIDGTKVLDIDVGTDNSAGSQTSFTATTGQTVTLNRSSTGNKLIYVPADVGVWQGDGTDDYLVFPSTAAPPAGSHTIVMAYRRFGTSANANARPYSSESAANDGTMLTPQSNNILRARFGGATTSVTSTASSAFSEGEVVTIAAIYDSGADTIEAWDSTNGRAASASTTGVGTVTHSTAPKIGVRAYNTSVPDTADVFSVVIFESALSDEDLTTVSNYLIAKAQGTVFTPATITATTTLPTPTITEITVAQPATITATTTLPTPTIILPSTNPVTLTIRDTGHTQTTKEQTQ